MYVFARNLQIKCNTRRTSDKCNSAGLARWIDLTQHNTITVSINTSSLKWTQLGRLYSILLHCHQLTHCTDKHGEKIKCRNNAIYSATIAFGFMCVYIVDTTLDGLTLRRLRSDPGIGCMYMQYDLFDEWINTFGLDMEFFRVLWTFAGCSVV